MCSSPVGATQATSERVSNPEAGSGFAQNSIAYGLASLIAYAISMVKTVVVMHLFGTSAEIDAFNVSILLPNLLGTLATSTATAALIPALSVAQRPSISRQSLYRSSLISFALVCGLLSCVLATFSGPLPALIAPSFSGERQLLVRRMMPSATLLFVFTAVYAYAAAELMSRRRFFFAAIAPGFSSGISLFIILLSSNRDGELLLRALLVGTFIQAVSVVLLSWRIGHPGRINIFLPEVWKPLRNQATLVAVSTLGVVNSFIDQFFSTRLGPGSISALNYAATLHNVVMQVVVMSLGWGALPGMSALASDGEITRLLALVRRCVLTGVACTAAVTVVVLLFGDVLIRSLFQHGKFDATSSYFLYIAWAGYSLGLLPAAVSMMAARLLNALQLNGLLLKLGVILCVANGLLDFVLMRWLGLVGIAASTSVVYLCSAALLYTFINHRLGRVLDGTTLRRMLMTVAITFLAALPALGSKAAWQFSVGRALIAITSFVVALCALYCWAGLIRVRNTRPFLEIAWKGTA